MWIKWTYPDTILSELFYVKLVGLLQARDDQRDSKIRDARIIIYGNRLHPPAPIADGRPILAKTEVQMVILQSRSESLLVQKLWHKMQKHKWYFFTKLQKSGIGNVCILCHNFWTN